MSSLVSAATLACLLGANSAAARRQLSAHKGDGVAAWKQCGGKDFGGPTQCAQGLECVALNEWWSQCDYPKATGSHAPPPAATSPPTGATPDGMPSAPPPAGDTIALYGQCGGVDYSGATACEDGSLCIFQNYHYWQCLPEADVPSGTFLGCAPDHELTDKGCAKADQLFFKGIPAGLQCCRATATPATPTPTPAPTPNPMPAPAPAPGPMAPAPAPAPTSDKIALYGQCGGFDYNGATMCEDGSLCLFQNKYYSQCVKEADVPSGAFLGCGPDHKLTDQGCAKADQLFFKGIPAGLQCCRTGATPVAPAPAPTPATPAPAPAPSPMAPAPTSGKVAKYGQCGGVDFKGSMECEAGNLCVFMNQYYWQCLPKAGVPSGAFLGCGPDHKLIPEAEHCKAADRLHFRGIPAGFQCCSSA